MMSREKKHCQFNRVKMGNNNSNIIDLAMFNTEN